MFLPIVACAEDVEIDGLWYNLVKKMHTAEVIQYKDSQKYSGDIIIPETVTYDNEEYKVNSIGNSAFGGCTGLISITIGDNVTTIGSYAFSGCTYLTSVSFGKNVTEIYNYAFWKCSQLVSVIIPNSVTTIHDGTFWECKKLKSITIGSGVTHMDGNIFNKCSELASVHIADLASWCNITFGSGANPLSLAHHLFLNGEEVKDLIIPNSVTTINDFVFENCTSITSITIPNSVTTIGAHAFANCSGLTSITIPNSVECIGGGAFSNCDNLVSATLPCNLTEINAVFFYCTKLASIDIPNSVISIADDSFSHCTSLTSVTIPNSVTTIGSRAFQNCSSLSSIVIGKEVTSIGSLAFGYCPEITDVYSYATKVPIAYTQTFVESYIEYATLHVPEIAYESYRTTEPWSNFGTIKVIDGETPIVEKCATPTITYSNGKVRFACETEGVEFVPSIMVTPNQLQNGNELSIGGTFTVSVYAVKEGYDNSDTATMTINMSQMGDVNADGELNAADITAVVNAILGNKET